MAAPKLPTGYAPAASPASAALKPFRVTKIVRKGTTNTPNLFTNVAPVRIQNARGKVRRLCLRVNMTGNKKPAHGEVGGPVGKGRKEKTRDFTLPEGPAARA